MAAITARYAPKSVNSHESEPSILAKEMLHEWLRLIEWLRGSSMSRTAASLPDGVFWGTEGISRVSSPSERRKCDAYFRIRVTGEFEGSMVQVHLVFRGCRGVKLQTVGKKERRGEEPRSTVDGGGEERASGRSEGSCGRRERVVILSSNKILITSQLAENPRQPARRLRETNTDIFLNLSGYSLTPAPATIMAARLLVDVHTHVYLPRYATFLRQRVNAPYIFTRPSLDGKPDEHRLRILDDEPAEGRPVGPQVSAFLHRSAAFASD